jgi:O-antigen/teichoic acid export membrane protein
MALAGRSIALWSSQVFVAAERSRLALQQEGIFRPLEAVLGLALVYSGGGVLGVALLHALIWWLQAVRGIGLVRGRLFSVVPCWQATRLLALARAGAPIAISGLLSGWLVTGPLILYARQDSATPESVGQLALPMQATGVLMGLVLSASGAAIPVLSRAVLRGDRKDLRFLAVSAVAAVTFGLLASALAWLAGPKLVPAVFGASFGTAGKLLGASLALLIPLAVGNAASQVLFAHGRAAGMVASSLLGAAVLLVALPWLVAQWGPIGAIAAAGIGTSSWAVAAAAAAYRRVSQNS